MREILFRGKRVDNGEWVYGYYVRTSEENADYSLFLKDWIYDYEGWCRYNVIPETVGQCTGLDDKNGVKIFEGDVLHWDSHWGWYVGYENGAFRRIPLDDIQRINWEHYPLEREGLETWEIIGNIHDNPELMGGGAELIQDALEWLEDLDE